MSSNDRVKDGNGLGGPRSGGQRRGVLRIGIVRLMLKRSLIVVFVVLGVASACSSAAESGAGSAPPGSGPPPTAGTTTIVESSGTTRVLEPPITFVGSANAEAVVKELNPRLPISDEEAPCLAQRLDKDAGLLGRVSQGVQPGSDDFSQIMNLVQRCKLAVTFAPKFAEVTNESHGGTLSAGQLQCLRDAVSNLSDQQLELLFNAGVNPQGSLAPQGAEVMTSMLKGCGL